MHGKNLQLVAYADIPLHNKKKRLPMYNELYM